MSLIERGIFMQTVTDHLNRTITIPTSPKRIISLCPAITATLFAVNLEQEIVGRTRFCIFPEDKIANVTIVGGTKDMKIEVIRSLQPDLIIAEKEENTKEMVTTLDKEFPVFVFEIQSIEDNKQMIEDLGKITNRIKEAAQLIKKIEVGFQNLPNLGGKKAAYMIWRTPYMVVGQSTYITSLLEALQLKNPFTSFEGRYPVVTLEDLEQAHLDYLFLATEPFRFQEKHVTEMAALLPDVHVSLIDGEMFWYGVNMIEGAKYLNEKFD